MQNQKLYYPVALLLLLVLFVNKIDAQKTFENSFTANKVATVSIESSGPVTKGGNWNNKKAAVVLTYDDALHVHLDHALPALDSQGFKGTFYISGYSGAIHSRLGEWRAAAANGHELGNHTLFHPCNGKLPGRSFVKPDYDLSSYSISRIEDEIRMTNTLLTAIDGKESRTFAYPCSDTKISDTEYIKNLQNAFTGARAVRAEAPQIGDVQLYNIGSFMVSGQTGDELVAQVKKAMEKNALLVFLFHGVGGEHNLDVSLAAHRQLLLFLKQNEADIWVAPMTEVATYIHRYQQENKK